MNKILKVLKNFYLVFSVCVLVVLAVGISYMFKYAQEQKVRKMALEYPSTYIEPKSETASTVKDDVKKDEITAVKEESGETKKVATETNNEVNVMSIINDEEFKIEKPVKNEIINKFSGDELIYSKTFNDYRTHNGIDIKSERSEPVFAVQNGVVENVYADALEGIVIIINHGNGYQSVYKNLSSDKMVKKGESVTKGQTISGVGETAIFEAAEESHIHFELLINGKYVNPEEYFE